MNWYCIYTKPRHEDSVFIHLQHAGIEALNVKMKVKRCTDTKFIEQTVPLFPSYLFAKFDMDKCFHLISYTRGVRYIIGKDTPILVHDEIINAIKGNIDERNNVIMRPKIFEKGDTVFIREGMFKDFYGIFERKVTGSERVMILLDTINWTVTLNSHLLTNLSKHAH